MRPKRRILLFDQDEQRLSTRRFMLETNGYRVLGAQDEAGALESAANGYETAIVCLPCSGRHFLCALHRMEPERPIVLLAENKEDVPEAHNLPADVKLIGAFYTADLLQRVKVLSQRKRGPKKGTPKPAVTAVAAIAQEAAA